VTSILSDITDLGNLADLEVELAADKLRSEEE
jgi:hypothetical protein